MADPGKERKDGDLPAFLQERPVYRAINLFPEEHSTYAAPVFMTLSAQETHITRSSSLEQETTRGTGPQSETLVIPSFSRTEFWTGSPSLDSSAGAFPTHHGAPRKQLLGTGAVDLGAAFSAKELTHSMAAMSIAQVEKPMEVPDLPPYVEQFSSFITSRDPRVVLQSVANAFNANTHVDYELSAHKAKITGVAYENNSACMFKVKIFQRRGDKAGSQRYVVEFQRRSGDVVAFSNFYRTTLHALGSAIVERPFATPTLSLPAVTSPAATAAKAQLAAVAPPVAPLSQVIIDDGTQQCLFDMASSKDSDVQREAVRFLAGASTNPTNQAKLAAGKDKIGQLVGILGQLLASKDKEVVRCAAMLVANLAQQPSARPALLPLVPQELHLLDLVVPASSVNALLFREVRRQIARTLVSLSASCKAELLKDAPSRLAILSVLEKQRAAADDSLRPLIDTTLANLGQARS